MDGGGGSRTIEDEGSSLFDSGLRFWRVPSASYHVPRGKGTGDRLLLIPADHEEDDCNEPYDVGLMSIGGDASPAFRPLLPTKYNKLGRR